MKNKMSNTISGSGTGGGVLINDKT